MSFKQLSPLVKLGIWGAAVVSAASLIQLGAWTMGTGFDVVGSSGTLLALAIITLLAVMSADQRPVADFGLIVGPSWRRLFFQGAAVGAGAHLAIVLLAWATGVVQLAPTSPTVSTWGKAWLNGMTAIPLSVTQQVLFTGYLLTMLRDRYRPLTAVVLSAAMFAVIGRLDAPSLLLSTEMLPLLCGLFLTAALLGLLRLRTGSILTSAGLLAGWLFLNRVLGRARLLQFQETALWSEWIAPQGDYRRGPVLWLALGAGIVHCLVMLRRHGERQPELSGAAIDADFKRVFPLSNGAMLAPLDVWLGRLCDAGFRVGGAYIPRLIAILVLSTLNTLLTLPERLLVPWLLRRRPVPPPLFILGVHRSGTTHLHNLLSLDRQFTSPRAYHIMNPAGCVATGWLVTPLLGLFLPYKRPMDGVRFHLFAPQEEEFALAGLSGRSPYWGPTFPRRWPHYDRYMFPDRLPPAERAAWRRDYVSLLRRLVLWSRRRPLLKNPYNTGRLAELHDLFPQAQFIHICRHPAVVYQSNLHMCREAHVMNQLQDPDPECSYPTRFLDNYRELEDAYYVAADGLPPETVVELRFEDLERDPLGVVRRLYARLGLEYTDDFDRRLRTYLDGLSDYQKNRHRPIPEDDLRQVREKLGPLLDRWQYDLDEPSRRAA